MNLILTVPVDVDFSKVAQEPCVSGVRLNTTYTGSGHQTIEQILLSMRRKAGGKDVWVDLKARQPRIAAYNVEFLKDSELHRITLTHSFKLDTKKRPGNPPAELYLDDGFMRGIVERVEKNTLIIPSSITKREGLFFPRRGQIGIRPGTSVNILHPSFKVKGFFTKNDIEYIKVAKRLNMHKYMLSYVECTNDVTLMFKHDPLAEVVLKIESERGLEFVVNEYPKLKRRYGNQLNLMAARGDLYMEINMPDQIIDASMKILEVEPNAIMASRLMGSLKYFPKKDVECADVTDLYANMMFGYKQFMVGDELTTKEDRLIQSILLFDVMSDKYETFQRAKKRSICRPAGYSNGGGVIAKPEFSPPGAPQPLAYEEDVEDPSPGYTPPQTFNAEDCVELEDSLDQKPKVVDSESDANGFSGSPPYFPSQRSSVTSRTVHGVGPHRRQSKLNLEED